MACEPLFLTADFTAAPGTQTTAILESAPSADGPWTFIREVELTGQVGATYDTTPTDGVATWYRWTGDPGGTTIVQGPIVPPASGDVVCVRDPLRPWANLVMGFCATPEALTAAACGSGGEPFVWAGWGAKVRRADAGIFDRFDSETPAVVYGRRKNLDSSIRFLTKTDAARRAVYDLFSWGGPLQITAPAAYGWEPYVVQPGDLTEAYLADPIDQRWPHRLWSAPVTVVDDVGAGPIQGTVCANWCTVAETWGSFADMTAAGGTWLDILAGTTQCPGGEPPEAFLDTFTRTVSGGWGTTDTGQAWTVAVGTAANFSVDGTRGVSSHPVTGGTHLISAPYSSPDVNAVLNFSLDQVPAGDTALLFLTARTADANNFYSARISFAAGGAMSLSVRKRVAGVDTSLANLALGVTYVAGVAYRMRFTVQGSTLSAKVWAASGSEPGAFQVTASDPELTAAGGVGVRTLVNAVTNPLPFIYRFDRLEVMP